jgi:alkanesulfonate monooxygenase SsuD/methylene tetrahydromethanopterin reductase-like flavin-dependent oxidoreductase (luciferase family)
MPRHTAPGSQLLARSLAACGGDPEITSAQLHVHCGDEEAQAWYAGRGFQVQVRPGARGWRGQVLGRAGGCGAVVVLGVFAGVSGWTKTREAYKHARIMPQQPALLALVSAKHV